MKGKLSRVALVAFLLGCVGMFFSQAHAVGLRLAAVPLGPLALCFAFLATWLIRRKNGALRGRALAVWGGVLGIVGSVLSLTALAGIFAQQFQPDQWRDQQAQHLRQLVRGGRIGREPAAQFTSNLPIIVLRGDVSAASKHHSVLAQAEFFGVGEDGRTALARGAAQSSRISIHPRGTSSLQLPKHSYTFHTLDAQTNQTKIGIFGLAKDDDWILYAPFEDKTLIRDALAYELSNEMGQYAPRTRYVELFIQDSGDELSMSAYEGVYLLVEKIKRSPDRVNIAKLEPEQKSEPEISGGYIVRRDHADGSGRRFQTRHGGPYFYVYPNEEKITKEQRAWLTQYFNEFEEALYGRDFTDPTRGYAAYLDTDAFIDAHWLIELSKNVDGFRYSAYLTKDRNGKLKPGPAWDWNRSFGNANYYGGWKPQGWYSNNLRPNEISWYMRLREDPAFAARSRARWRVLRNTVLDPKKISARIDELATQLKESQERNFRRWPILGEQVTCNHFVGDSYQEEVDWLKNWIGRRIDWMDQQVQKSEKGDADQE